MIHNMARFAHHEGTIPKDEKTQLEIKGADRCQDARYVVQLQVDVSWREVFVEDLPEAQQE